MKKVLKRFSLIVLFCVLALCALSMTACGDKDIFKYSNTTDPYISEFEGLKDGLAVRAANTDISGDVKIPAVHDGQCVIAIDKEAFANCTKLTTIRIPAGITLIKTNAFKNCPATLYIPWTVKTILTTADLMSPGNAAPLYPKEIYYDGDYSTWQQIHPVYSFYTDQTVIHLTNGEIRNNTFFPNDSN